MSISADAVMVYQKFVSPAVHGENIKNQSPAATMTGVSNRAMGWEWGMGELFEQGCYDESGGKGEGE